MSEQVGRFSYSAERCGLAAGGFCGQCGCPSVAGRDVRSGAASALRQDSAADRGPIGLDVVPLKSCSVDLNHGACLSGR
jgi:hypothetical protein